MDKVDIQNLIMEYLKKKQMENVKVIVHKTEGGAVNYISTILKATSTSEKNGEVFKDKYVIKFLKADQFLQSDGKLENNEMFVWSKCEQYAYEIVLPTMYELQRRYNVNTDFQTAEYVNALLQKDKQYIIFKDLTLRGYTLRDRNLMLDIDHVAIFTKRLAQFHAFSMALKHLDPEKYREVTKVNLEEKLFAENSRFVNFYNDTSNFQLSTFIEKVESLKVREKLMKIKENFPEICRNLARDDHASPYSVIGHGDVWNSNIMFKYEHNKPVDAILLDWQIMRHNSPVIDLFHLMITSIGENLQNSVGFDFIINTYYNHLSNELKKYSLDSNIIYPKDVFWSHLRTYAPLGLRLCLIMWPFHCRMYDDTITLHQLMSNIEGIFNMSAHSKNRYDKMWNFILEVFNKYGMLDV